jgi:hypothetical protein
MNKTVNPWTNFEISNSMVHDLDRDSFNLHNSRVTADYRFLDQLAPEPWIGNKQAELLVLLANPGATRGDVARKQQKGAQRINELSIANLRGEIKDYPHFFFNPELSGTDGYKWYVKRFRHLIEATSEENVSKKLLSCELVPYHSFSWKKPRQMPPTQAYTYQLVSQAMERDAVILIGRGRKDWFKNVPGLEKYKRYFQPSSTQCAYVSPKNYGKNFNKILETIS